MIAWDEMWTYCGARRGKKREDCRIRTAVIQEADGSRWEDFEVGDRSEGPFQRLYERLAEAGLYRSGAYRVYAGWLPPERHAAGKGGAVNWNEGLHSAWRGKLNRLVRRTEGYTKKQEGGDAGLFSGPGLLAPVAETQYPLMLRIPTYFGRPLIR